jgi:hypothetical protein
MFVSVDKVNTFRAGTGGVSSIGAVARNGPPDDFNKQATEAANYARGGPPRSSGPPPTFPSPGEAPPGPEPPESPDPFDEAEPTPWYRKPAGIIAWVVAVLVLIALIVYGIMELLGPGEGTNHTPSTSTTSTPATNSTTETTTTSPPAETTTTEPPTSSAAEPPVQQPTQRAPRQPTQQPEPTHRHHLPQLPSVITIPEVPTVITLPPGLS